MAQYIRLIRVIRIQFPFLFKHLKGEIRLLVYGNFLLDFCRDSCDHGKVLEVDISVLASCHVAGKHLLS